MKVTRGENIELTDFTYNYIPTNKIIYEDFQKGEDSKSSNSSKTKVKGFKNLTKEQYDYISNSFKKYSNLKMKDLLFKINDECPIQGFKCTSHILRKIKGTSVKSDYLIKT